MPKNATAELDAYESARRERADLLARYDAAIQSWDRLDMARIEVLAADYDRRHPGQQSLLAELESMTDVPAAA